MCLFCRRFLVLLCMCVCVCVYYIHTRVCVCVCVCVHYIHTRVCTGCACVCVCTINIYSIIESFLLLSVMQLITRMFTPSSIRTMGRLQLELVGSLKLWVSFAKEPYKRDYILQKRPMIVRSLIIVATAYWYRAYV